MEMIRTFAFGHHDWYTCALKPEPRIWVLGFRKMDYSRAELHLLTLARRHAGSGNEIVIRWVTYWVMRMRIQMVLTW